MEEQSSFESPAQRWDIGRKPGFGSSQQSRSKINKNHKSSFSRCEI